MFSRNKFGRKSESDIWQKDNKSESNMSRAQTVTRKEATADPEQDLLFVSCDNFMDIVQKEEKLTESGAMVLTEKQQNALRQFKERTKDLQEEFHYSENCLKWLKARCFDVAKAENMYRESVLYRKRMGVHRILHEYTPPKISRDYMSGGYCGFDKEGSPIRFELFGKLDMKGLMASCKKSDMIKTKLLGCETVVQIWEEQSRKLGKRVDGLVVIFDMKDATTRSLWKPGLQMYLYLVQILEDNYPEMLKQMFVINAPAYFNLFWYVCKPLVSEDMRKKIFICSKNYSTILLKYISSEELPVCFGGSRTDCEGDPNCSISICQGGVVPDELFINKDEVRSTMKSQLIPASDSFSVRIVVDDPNRILRWEFSTDCYDVDFVLKFHHSLEIGEKDEQDAEVLIPVARVQSQQFIEDGYIVCYRPGTYILIFDNTRSWFTPKNLYYKTYMDTTLAGH